MQHIVFRNHLLPIPHRACHLLKTYLQRKKEYRDYTTQEIKIALKSIREDKYKLRTIKEQMEDYNINLQEENKKYMKKYIQPLKKVPTYQELLIFYAQSVLKKQQITQKQHLPLEHSKLLYRQVQRIEPAIKYRLWKYSETRYQKIIRRQALKLLKVPILPIYSVQQLKQASTKQIHFSQEFLQQIRAVSLFNDQLLLINQQEDKQQAVLKSTEKYQNKFHSMLQQYRQKVDYLCINQNISSKKLMKLIQNQHTTDQFRSFGFYSKFSDKQKSNNIVDQEENTTTDEQSIDINI